MVVLVTTLNILMNAPDTLFHGVMAEFDIRRLKKADCTYKHFIYFSIRRFMRKPELCKPVSNEDFLSAIKASHRLYSNQQQLTQIHITTSN